MEKHTDQLFKVEGMSCQHCVAAITRSIQAQDAQAQVTVDLAQAQVRIVSNLPAPQLAQVLLAEGYPATLCAR
jgi:copper chaperone